MSSIHAKKCVPRFPRTVLNISDSVTEAPPDTISTPRLITRSVMKRCDPHL